MTGEWLGAAGVGVLLGVSMALLAACARRGGLAPESARKVLHVEMGFVTLAFPWIFASAWPVAALALATVGWFRVLRAPGPWQHLFAEALGERRAGSRGESWFACGVCLAFLATAHQPVQYCTAILVLALADSAAAVVGLRWGRPRRMAGGASKSLAGSLAFFTVAFLVAALVPTCFGAVLGTRLVAVAILVALATTLIEALLGDGLDNLLLPVGTVAALELGAAADGAGLGAAVIATTVALAAVMRPVHAERRA